MEHGCWSLGPAFSVNTVCDAADAKWWMTLQWSSLGGVDVRMPSISIAFEWPKREGEAGHPHFGFTERQIQGQSMAEVCKFCTPKRLERGFLSNFQFSGFLGPCQLNEAGFWGTICRVTERFLFPAWLQPHWQNACKYCCGHLCVDEAGSGWELSLLQCYSLWRCWADAPIYRNACVVDRHGTATRWSCIPRWHPCIWNGWWQESCWFFLIHGQKFRFPTPILLVSGARWRNGFVGSVGVLAFQFCVRHAFPLNGCLHRVCTI